MQFRLVSVLYFGTKWTQIFRFQEILGAFKKSKCRQAERVNGLYRQNQRDEGGGLMSEFPENFVNYVIWMDLQVL